MLHANEELYVMKQPLLAGKIAIITGGAGGLGQATAELFVAEGASIVIADINSERGEALAETLGDRAIFKMTNVAKRDHMQALVDFAVEHFGRLDIMFNNAGFSGQVHERLLDDEFEDFEELMAINLLSVMTGSRYACLHMAKQGGGAIINTTSLAALNPGCPLLTYRAAKAGVIQFSKSIARDVAEYGIRVNCIAPGRVPAGMTFYDMTESIRASQPLQRQGVPRDVANAALYLGSDLSLHTTGTVIPVDGGASLGGPLNGGHKKIT